MPIEPADIQFRLSGGGGNSSPASSLGGAMSSVTGGANIFGPVDGAEAAVGSVRFRCEYICNNDPSRTLVGAKLWILTNTPSATTSVEIGAGVAGVNGTEPAIANDLTAPAGVTFIAADSFATAVELGDIPPLGRRPFWTRRTVNAGTAARAADAPDTFTHRILGDSFA